MNELDQFIKHKLKIKYYLRYCDDFVILKEDSQEFPKLISQIAKFLDQNLKLKLHQEKIIIRKLKQGVDFVGYIILPHYRVLRTKTKKRMLKRLNENNYSSYWGLLKWYNSHNLKKKLRLTKN